MVAGITRSAWSAAVECVRAWPALPRWINLRPPQPVEGHDVKRVARTSQSGPSERLPACVHVVEHQRGPAEPRVLGARAGEALAPGLLGVQGKPPLWVGYDEGGTPISTSTRAASTLLDGSMIRTSARCRNTSSPPAAAAGQAAGTHASTPLTESLSPRRDRQRTARCAPRNTEIELVLPTRQGENRRVSMSAQRRRCAADLATTLTRLTDMPFAAADVEHIGPAPAGSCRMRRTGGTPRGAGKPHLSQALAATRARWRRAGCCSASAAPIRSRSGWPVRR